MTSVPPSTAFGPSPIKSRNPFAKPVLPHSSSSFKRVSLLPSLPSPAKTCDEALSTPRDKLTKNSHVGSAPRGKNGWRLLWRGGFEVGKEGYRLEGVTFFAQISFPNLTPSLTPKTNPFDSPSLNNTLAATASPFDQIPESDTDLCLSLESMRGRKYLKIRGVVDLAEDEIVEGADETGVQMSIAPSAPLLAGYFTNLLCRHPTLSSKGRTLSAVAIGLGDDIDSTSSTVLVYGQQSDTDPGSLRLLVGRKKPPPPPTERKVRPGEPLPRPPLFFPSNSKPAPFPRGRTGRSLSRAPSTNSIYAPPPLPLPVTNSIPHVQGSGKTPGRRGEKRPRSSGDVMDQDDRKRKAGKIVPPSKLDIQPRRLEGRLEGRLGDDGGDEDIFGKSPNLSIGPSANGDKGMKDVSSSKRPKIPQQVLDNKGVIRKQTMLLMEEMGCLRSHPEFKDVFGMTTKGVYFALRDTLDSGAVTKVDIQRIIKGHLDMYLDTFARSTGHLSQVKEEEEEMGDEDLFEQSAQVNQSIVIEETVVASEGVMSEPISDMATSEPLSEGILSDNPFSESGVGGACSSDDPVSPL